MIKTALTYYSSKQSPIRLLKLITIGLAFVITACSSAQPRINNENVAFCSTINHQTQKLLSKYLAPFSQKMKESTGVYVLEEDTESLLSRAWLSQNAEKTIDIQYFIFSADNIGLIAADYLVKAAERGVKVRLLVDDLMVDAKGDELLKLTAHKNLSIKIYNPLANIGKNIFQKMINLTTNFHELF